MWPKREKVWAGVAVVAHWGFVWDDNDGPAGPVSGEVLLLANGALLRRMGSSPWGETGTTYSFDEWAPVQWWDGGTDPKAARRRLRGHGYGLFRPGPTPIGARSSGPFPGLPRRPVPLGWRGWGR